VKYVIDPVPEATTSYVAEETVLVCRNQLQSELSDTLNNIHPFVIQALVFAIWHEKHT